MSLLYHFILAVLSDEFNLIGVSYVVCELTQLEMVQVRLEPLMVQINRVKDLPFPGFESFPAWEARAIMSARANGGLDPNDPLRSQAGYGSTPMPFLGETKVIISYTCKCL